MPAAKAEGKPAISSIFPVATCRHLNAKLYIGADNISKTQCNRQWPCDHCHARKISHLCQFGPKTSTTYSSSVGNINSRCAVLPAVNCEYTFLSCRPDLPRNAKQNRKKPIKHRAPKAWCLS